MDERPTRTGYVEIHGLEYETVAHRLLRFRAERPDWRIQTEIVTLDDKQVVMRAEIWSGDRLMSTGHAREVFASSSINKQAGLENCETSALGRALALLGYHGTDIASADEIRAAAFRERVLEVEMDTYFARIVEKVRAEDAYGYMELWRELSREAQIAMWGKFNSKQKSWMREAEQLVTVAEKEGEGGEK